MNPPTTDRDDEPRWLQIAREEIGTAEVRGPDANGRILEYFSATKLAPVSSDEVPWCSAFLNWVMKQAGVEGTRKANARSWLDWGLALTKPRMGCIVVLARGDNPTQGHVALWIGESRDSLLLLGGNQSNKVCKAAYPKVRLLGYRWPIEKQTPSAA